MIAFPRTERRRPSHRLIKRKGDGTLMTKEAMQTAPPTHGSLRTGPGHRWGRGGPHACWATGSNTSRTRPAWPHSSCSIVCFSLVYSVTVEMAERRQGAQALATKSPQRAPALAARFGQQASALATQLRQRATELPTKGRRRAQVSAAVRRPAARPAPGAVPPSLFAEAGAELRPFGVGAPRFPGISVAVGSGRSRPIGSGVEAGRERHARCVHMLALRSGLPGRRGTEDPRRTAPRRPP